MYKRLLIPCIMLISLQMEGASSSSSLTKSAVRGISRAIANPVKIGLRAVPWIAAVCYVTYSTPYETFGITPDGTGLLDDNKKVNVILQVCRPLKKWIRGATEMVPKDDLKPKMDKPWVMELASPFIDFSTKERLGKLAVSTIVAPFILNDLNNVRIWAYAKCCNWLYEGKPADRQLSFDERAEYLADSVIECDGSINSQELYYLAHATNGCTQEQLDQIVEQAVCARRNCDLRFNDLDAAIDMMVRKIKSSQDDEEQGLSWRAAYYAGVAMSHYVGELPRPLLKVSLIPQNSPENPIGGAAYFGEGHCNALVYDDFAAACMVAVMPMVAQEILLGTATYDAMKMCKMQAFAHAYKAVLKGADESSLSRSERDNMRNEAWKLVDQCITEMRERCRERREQLTAIAQNLYTKKQMTIFEIENLVQ